MTLALETENSRHSLGVKYWAMESVLSTCQATDWVSSLTYCTFFPWYHVFFISTILTSGSKPGFCVSGEPCKLLLKDSRTQRNGCDCSPWGAAQRPPRQQHSLALRAHGMKMESIQVMKTPAANKEAQVWFPLSLTGPCSGHGNSFSILNIAEVPGHTCRSQVMPLVFSALCFQELGTFCISQSAGRRKPIQNTN